MRRRMNTPTCHRCGTDLDYVEITSFADREPKYIATSQCDCPSPRCPLCNARLGESRTVHDDECPTLTCCLFACVVPLPAWS